MAKKADGAPAMKKSDAMRAAIAEGHDKPQAASAFIKEKFGLDVTPQVFSTFKSIENKKNGNKGRRSSRGAKPEGNVTGNGLVADPADLARNVKKLVEQHGAKAVADMAKVFGE